MQKITPCLWFEHQAEEAAKFYTSIFNNSKIGAITRYTESGAKVSGRPKGTVLTVNFEINGQEFMALNGGPIFKFTEATSFIVNCETQKELDHYWGRLSEGGDKKAQQCGWLKDKYGISWQIVPVILGQWLRDKDPKKVEMVMAALLQMKKLDIATLKRVYEKA